MQITEIKVLPVDGDTRLKAYVTVKLDGCVVIRDMKIIDGAKGFFVAMPSKKLKDGSYLDLVHPIDKSTRDMFEVQVLEKYKEVSGDQAAGLFGPNSPEPEGGE